MVNFGVKVFAPPPRMFPQVTNKSLFLPIFSYFFPFLPLFIIFINKIWGGGASVQINPWWEHFFFINSKLLRSFTIIVVFTALWTIVYILTNLNFTVLCNVTFMLFFPPKLQAAKASSIRCFMDSMSLSLKGRIRPNLRSGQRAAAATCEWVCPAVTS